MLVGERGSLVKKVEKKITKNSSKRKVLLIKKDHQDVPHRLLSGDLGELVRTNLNSRV